MKIFFAGTADCAVPALRAISKAYPLVGVLTAPPSRAGRGKKQTESAVARAVSDLKTNGAISEDVFVCAPEKLNAEFRAAVSALHPDILVCFAYGKIFGPKTLALFPRGALNIHPSLLPRWRGPSPVPAAILAGDTVTGVTVQYMAQEMDAGDIIIQKELSIEPADTTESLLYRCAELGADLIIQALNMVENGSATAIAQNDTMASYCRLLQKDSGLICWQSSAVEIDRKIRAYAAWPGAFTRYKGGNLIIVQAHPYTGNALSEHSGSAGLVLGVDKQEGLLIQTGNGILAVQMLQRETKKAMNWKDFLNGASGFIGETLL